MLESQPSDSNAFKSEHANSTNSSRAFPRNTRLTLGPEIERVRKEGKRLRTSSIDVRAIASLYTFPRVGIVVPRYGHSAVERNRVKRRLREIVRLEMLPAVQPVDVVLRAAPRAYERTFVQLREELRKVTRQLSVPTVNEPVVNGPAAREPVPRAEP